MTPIEAINNVAKAYQDLAIVLLAIADKTVGVPAAQAMTVNAKEALDNKANKLSAENPEDYTALMEEPSQLK